MAAQFKRAYKACEPCRKNKAKCDLDPSATSCLRCLREHKECIFPAERSTKRAKFSGGLPAENNTNESVISQTQQAGLVQGIGAHQAGPSTQAHATTTVTPQQPARRPSTVQRLPINQRAGVGTPSEAERPDGQCLRPSAGQNAVQQRHVPPETDRGSRMSANLQNDVLNTFVTNSSDAIGLLFRAAEQNDSDSTDEQTPPEHACRDEVQGSVSSMPSPGLASDETIALWEQHRFVRQGWFTAREAVSYLEFFFLNLSPLSPVADSYYADHRNHKRLILEEPLLCCTLLMIASRHHVPARGGGGGRARSDFVHVRMWRHVEHLIQRITFGSEKYSLAKTRTLGSIQALLLIIEWHPRALHFPPEGDGWDASLAPSIDDTYKQSISSEATKKWREDVFEPAKRSERMSWMLVGLATALAHELGVFDHEDDVRSTEKHQSILRTQRLLFLYTSQLSLRLGCSNIFPQGSNQSIAHVIDTEQEQASREREILITRWIEITKLLTTANEMLFGSQAAIKQMFKSSRYVMLLEHFEPLLHRWRTDFDEMSCPTISEASRQILLVEYYFVRMYINSIAVQALVERASSVSSSTGLLDQDFLRSESSQDFRFVTEVRDASVEILRLVTKLSEDYVLQYCPVRVYLRVVVASIYLLKTISLGSREADVTRSLTQLQRCIEALQSYSADDVHLSSRYATLIARHVRRFKRNFRVKKAPTTFSRAASRGPDSTSRQSSQQVNLQQNFHPIQHHDVINYPTFASDDITIPFDFNEAGMVEDWLAQPFNAQFAPFGTGGIQPASGLAIDSLDFLWNLST
ncbi:hypothetical protein OHC33_011181 [Knufia fluminis]|uniref:Zn(2)-C6 fungal-type domain-containing protein n=1 Tax=Knufia fluminis TaxID=191047 RepID=A0AAN8EWT2_9EURO|nr:hypothetical protein OHC33_011181 [Knufia fluminis]